MIAVLPATYTEQQLVGICDELVRRGWKAASSRGREQSLLIVSGPDSEEELEAALSAHADRDIISIGDARFYERSRRNRVRMHLLVAGLVLVLVFGLGIPVLSFMRAPREVFSAYEFVPVTTTERLQENSAQLVRVNSRLILIVRLNDLRLYALSAVCTHMEDCQLEWSDERHQIVCPCHGGVYDVYGNVVEGPPSIPLASFDVEVLGSDIRVRRGG